MAEFWRMSNLSLSDVPLNDVLVQRSNGRSYFWGMEKVFEDSPCYRFHFDQDKSLLEITLGGYYDGELHKDVEKECTLVIKGWSKAKSKQLGDERLEDIEELQI